MIRLASSLRVASIADTMAHARRIAPEVGVVRVTDITRLDRVGLPVFTSVRPDAALFSLSVSAGKGLTPDEAQVGAYMEAIELAYAEVERARPQLFAASAHEVLDGATRPDAIFDFGPPRGHPITRAERFDCVHATDLATGEQVVVPAEKVVFPFARSRHGGRVLFATEGNGIASGNSLEEATVHGLTEVIERDVHSFHNVVDRTERVHRDGLPDALREIVDRLDRRGFDLWLRHMPNEFRVPVFQAILRERDGGDLRFGYGCHVFRAIAATRAVTEAAQSRLSLIHGGRDDLFTQSAMARTVDEKRAFQDRHAQLAIAEHHGAIAFDDIPDLAADVTDITSALVALRARLATGGLARVLCAELGPPDLPIRIVRVVVPGSELFAHGFTNIGRRLRRALLQAGGHPEHSSSDTGR